MSQPATEEKPGNKFPKPGDTFIGRYEIEEVLNRGGFGCVYRAKQNELNRSVAIKILRPARRIGFSDDKAAESRRLDIVAKRFEREAQLVSQLRDPHTVMMYDYGTTDDGLLYMVLEYVDGRPLSEVLVRQGAMSADRCVKITRQVLMSLQEAHAMGMLHRDVKPPNIMLFDHVGRTDQVRVLDFGLAKSIDDPKFTADDPDLTDAEVLIGTPRYMSPEQIRGEKLSAATDIYSLGLCMYEMLVGKKAVTSNSTMNTLARHINEEPIRLPDGTRVPPKLREIVNRMLEKSLDDRYETVDIVLRELESWDEGFDDIEGLEPYVSEAEEDRESNEIVDDSDLFGGAPDHDEDEFESESTQLLDHLQEDPAEAPAAEPSEELDETFFSTELDENYGADYTMEARRKERKVRMGLAVVLLVFLLVAGLWIAFSPDEELELPERDDAVATQKGEESEDPDGKSEIAAAERSEDDESPGELETDEPSEFVFEDPNAPEEVAADSPDAGSEPDEVAVAAEEIAEPVEEEEEARPDPKPKRRPRPEKKKPTLKLRTLK